MNQYAFSCLISSITSLSIGLFVFMKNTRSFLNKIWLIFNFFIFMWTFGQFMESVIISEKSALFWNHFLIVGVIFIPVTFLHFIITLLNQNRQKKRILQLWYSVFFIFLVFSFNTLMIKGIIFKPPFGYYTDAGVVYFVFFGFFVSCVLYIYFVMLSEYKKLSGLKQLQLRYIMIASTIGFSTGTLNFLPAFNIPTTPYGNYLFALYPLIIAYAILRYSLMDIEIFIKKTTFITIGAVIPVALLYVGLSYMQSILQPIIGQAWLLIPVALSLVIGFGLYRFVRFILRMNEADLSKKFAYRPMLEKEAERTAKARDIRELATFVVRDVSSFTRLDHTAAFILNEQKDGYELMASVYRKKGMPRLEKGMQIQVDCPLVAYLKDEKTPAVYGQIIHDLQNRNLTQHERKFLESVESQMSILGAEIAVPSFCEEEMVGILNLGNKLTGEIFTPQDLQAFQTLANQTGRAIAGLLLKNEKVRLIVSSQKSLLETLEARDHYTRGHTERVSKYSQILGTRLYRLIHAIPNSLSALNWTAQMHDLGKVGIPDNILLKPGKLTDEEFAKIKEHPTRGIEILGPLKEWFGDDIIQGVVHHHENYDGTGYPEGQKGKDIHIFGRIIRVADAFDAMTTDRPYRKGLSIEQAIAEIKKFRKIQFDPAVADAFIALFNEGILKKAMDELKAKYG